MSSSLEKFQSLCRSLDDDGKVTVSAARSIVLYKSSGLCPADVFVDTYGALFPLKYVCSNKTVDLVKKSDWNIFGKNMEKFIETALEKESKARSNESSLKCVVKDPLKTNIVKLMETTGANCKEFRASLFQMKKLKLCGIHFFRWDGTPRQSVQEINWAICHYPSSSGEMMKVLKVLFGAAVLAALIYAISQNNAPTSNLLSPQERADIRKRLKELCLNKEDMCTKRTWDEVDDDYNLKTITAIDPVYKTAYELSSNRFTSAQHCSLIQPLARPILAKLLSSPREKIDHNNPYTKQKMDGHLINYVMIAYFRFLRNKPRLTAKEVEEFAALKKTFPRWEAEVTS
jgi:hypothetical protein